MSNKDYKALLASKWEVTFELPKIIKITLPEILEKYKRMRPEERIRVFSKISMCYEDKISEKTKKTQNSSSSENK